MKELWEEQRLEREREEEEFEWFVYLQSINKSDEKTSKERDEK